MSDTTPLKHQEGKEAPPPPPERGVLHLLGDIKAGRLNPKDLKTEDRRACVQHLSAEGCSVPEIAQVFKCSERTIARDRKAIQESQAIKPGSDLTCQLAGMLFAEAELATSRIRRHTRSPDTPPAVKVEADRVCFDIRSKLTTHMQSLGFAYTAMTQIHADLNHRSEELPSHDQILVQVEQLIQIANTTGDKSAVQQAAELKQQVAL